MRRVLETAPGGSVRFVREKLESAEAVMGRKRRGKATEDDGDAHVPTEAEARVLEAFVEREYATWPDASLPALDGRTPREAVKDPRLRPRLVELLKDMESHEERRSRDQGYGYDVRKLRRALGL